MNLGALCVVVESDCRAELHHQRLHLIAELHACHESAPDRFQQPLRLPTSQHPFPLVNLIAMSLGFAMSTSSSRVCFLSSNGRFVNLKGSLRRPFS
jgi:hypothetical protein